MLQFFYLPASPINGIAQNIRPFSTAYPEGIGHDPSQSYEGLDDLKAKAGEFLFYSLATAAVNHLGGVNLVADELKNDPPPATAPFKGFLFGFGVDGFRDRTQ